MSKGFKIGLAICLITALVLSYVSDIFETYTTSEIFIPMLGIGLVGIFIILFIIEKKNIEK